MSGRAKRKLAELSDADDGAAIGPFGSRMKSSVYTQSGVPVIRGTNISGDRTFGGDWVYVPAEFAERLPRCLLRSGDLVFPHRGSIGEVALIQEEHTPMLLSSSMMRFRPNPEVADSEFLFYYFRSPNGRHEILRFGSQVGTPGIGQPLTSLRQFEVPLPSPSVQKRIAALLRVLDARIALNRQQNATLEATARAVFRSWFVDFDPVRAKLDGRRPHGMDDATAKLFPASFQHQDGQLVPDGWEFRPLSEAFEVNPRLKLKKGAPAVYLEMKNVATEGSQPLATAERDFTSGTKFQNGDTLLARITPCLENGKTAFVDFLAEDEVGWGSTEFLVLRPKPPLPSCFGYLLARDAEFRQFAISQMTGSSGRQRVPADSLDGFSVAVPSEPVATAFAEVCSPLFDLMRCNGEQSRTLAELRDALLPKLLSGELTVPAAEDLITGGGDAAVD